MWLLVIVIGGWATVSDVKTAPLPEQQCRAIVTGLVALKGSIGAGCYGPNGEAFTLDDVKR